MKAIVQATYGSPDALETRDIGIHLALEAGGRVERHVMIYELAQQGEPRSLVGVVGVIGVGGQRVSRGRLIPGVHEPACLPELLQILTHRRVVRGEGGQRRKEPAESPPFIETV